MNIQNTLKMVLVVGTIGLFGCGGGGGGSSTPAATPPPTTAKTTTTISGKMEFPSLTSLVAKRVDSVVADEFVTVQAYNLQGVAVGNPITPTYDDTVPGSSTDFTKRQYSYSLPDVPIGKDYVIKAKRIENGKTQELKKLIEKSEVVADMPTQSLDSVSTAAVVVASQKLTDAMGITASDGSGNAVKITLGEALPVEAQGSSSLTKLSDAIVTDVAPKQLEASIQTAKTNSMATTGGLVTYVSSLSPTERQAFVDLVNMLNIVVTAVANNADPAKILAGESVTLSPDATAPQLKLFSMDTSGTVAQDTVAKTTIASQVFQDTVTSAVVSYVPPRVKLELSTNVTLLGVAFDVTVPVDATVRADATGKLDMALLTVPDGVLVDAQYDSTARKITINVVSANPLPAKFITLGFDRTVGKTLTSADFTIVLKKSSDSSGNNLNSSVPITKTVTSSGP